LETSQNELDNERQEKIEQLSSQSENYKKQIEELQQNVSDKDNERSSLTARLNEIEAELRKTIDDHALKSIKHEEDLQSVIEERNTLIEQQTHYSEQQ
jgi:seryl-tRNA synthetase